MPLTDRSAAIVKARKDLYGTHAGPFTMVNKATMHGKWVRMRHSLGFDDVTPHTLRHTCCSKLAQAGVDMARLQAWMGHSTMSTTLRYMQIKPNALEEIVNLLNGNGPQLRAV